MLRSYQGRDGGGQPADDGSSGREGNRLRYTYYSRTSVTASTGVGRSAGWWQEEGTGMLVLSRTGRQGIWIGDDVYVMVLSVHRGRVKLGIEAPADVRVDREELRTTRRKKSGEPAKAQV